MIYFYYVLISILIFIYLLIILNQLLQFYYMVHPYKVFLVTTRLKGVGGVLSNIVQKYKKDSNHFIELGSGRAEVANYIAKNLASKNIHFTTIEAVEGDWFTHQIARFFSLFRKVKQVTYLNLDIFKYQPPNNSLLYCYLFPRLLNRLYSRDYFKGHVLISLTFEIDGVQPTEVFTVENFQKRIYVYDFR
jgi:hypothetical protein